MIVFKLSWLPYMLVIAGVSILIEDGDPLGLIPLIIGGVWLYFKYFGGNSKNEP
ncbi:MAG: hypothetical protein IKW08_08620 [Roseburia sp.]|nr:hypothetical protein [Roseburia sp.]